ncbi:hypothetical protein DY000_02062936 [Brassica cretica]|uniref:Uncharacterized protein n=1 Tax=Brassica cretica TaxID=69181 RepID=A0ABQ7ANH5_BRACR|nr:hypothetical protein DY000_02062936 [Brassica cretica]
MCKSPTEMKIDRFLRRRLVYLFIVGAVEWSISSSAVLWRSPTRNEKKKLTTAWSFHQHHVGLLHYPPLRSYLRGFLRVGFIGGRRDYWRIRVEQSVKLVDAVVEGGKEPAHIEIEVEKYAVESGVEGGYDAQFKNLGNLVTGLQDQILYKLDEGLKHVVSTSQSW